MTMSRNVFSYWAAVLLLLCGCNTPSDFGSENDAIPDKVGYNLHIRPILSDKCFSCHGPDGNMRKAELRLDIAEEAYEALEKNPEAHAVVPGKPKESEVFLRISSEDPTVRMPPAESNLTLSAREIRLIERWIRQGAEYEPHWAFIAPGKSALPRVKNEEWVRNEVDRFILAKQEQYGFKPNPEAEKEMLLRRVCLDITGLPPSLELMDRFLSDETENAYEKIVDELLADSAYGEKMALHWMDLSRYADSHGYQDDYYRTQWPWRDWVIHALNENLPYDEFVTWQLAGDLLPDRNKETILATAFNRNHKITEESGAIDEEYRVMYVVDRTNTFGKALLGITTECAQCHDHKFDPLSQKEYFEIFAFFNNVAEYGIEEIVPGFSRKSPAKMPLLEITDEDVQGILSFVNKPDSTALAAVVTANVAKGRNRDMVAKDAGKLLVSVMGDLDTLRKTFLLERGDYASPGAEVKPGTPESILSFDEKYPKNRLGLAQWLFARENPLTARVLVNRIWREIFGRGIVATPGDFGMQGQLPSHPELLDWLAVDVMENGWNIKRLVRQIVTSSTYRQSSVVSERKADVDPDNVLLARAPRFRLPAELVRDVVLASSGLLVRTIGGPSVKPYQPPGLWEAATSGRGNLSVYQQDTLDALYRRGLYSFIKRTVPPPVMMIFDGSKRDECQVERLTTNTPLQALVMMNDPTVLEAARVLAARLLMKDISIKDKVETAFRLIVSRKPDKEELAILYNYYTEQVEVHRKQEAVAAKLLDVGEYPIPVGLDISSLAAMMQMIETIYNLEETITKS